MSRRVSIKPNLTLAELGARYRKSKYAVERTQWQVVWLLGQGKTTAEVVEATGYSIEGYAVLQDDITEVEHL